MKIKVKDLWQYIGVEIHISEEVAEEYCPIGFYNIIERSQDECFMLINSARTQLFHLCEYDDEQEIKITNSDIKARVEALVDGYTIQIIGLIADGWSEGGGMDLTPYNNMLKEYKKLLDIIIREDDGRDT